MLGLLFFNYRLGVKVKRHKIKDLSHIKPFITDYANDENWINDLIFTTAFIKNARDKIIK